MKIRIDDLQNLSAEPIKLFYDGLKSPETKEKYTRTLKRILCDNLEDLLHGSFEERAAELVNKSKNNPEFALSVLLAISRKLKARTELPKENPEYLNPVSINNYFKPLKKLFDMNGVAVVWDRLYATFPELNNQSKGRGYYRQEIVDHLKYAKGSLDRAIILTVASSGMREGAMRLKWENLQPVYRVNGQLVFDVTESELPKSEIVCAIFTIYAGTSAELPAFVTPEAYFAVMDYKMTWISEVGREPKPHETIFKKEGKLPIALRPTAIKRRIERLLEDAGIRTPLPKGKRRHEVPVMNGYRRFFDKVNKETISKDSPLAALIKKEYMMSHTGLVKTDKNYFQAHIFELVEEYLLAVPHLTINNEERERREKEKALQEKNALQDDKQLMRDIAQDMKEVKAEQARLQDQHDAKEQMLLKKIEDLEKKLDQK